MAILSLYNVSGDDGVSELTPNSRLNPVFQGSLSRQNYEVGTPEKEVDHHYHHHHHPQRCVTRVIERMGREG